MTESKNEEEEDRNPIPTTESSNDNTMESISAPPPNPTTTSTSTPTPNTINTMNQFMIPTQSILLRRSSISTQNSKFVEGGGRMSTAISSAAGGSGSISADRGLGAFLTIPQSSQHTCGPPAVNFSRSSSLASATCGTSIRESLPQALSAGIDLRTSKSIESPKFLEKVKFGASLSTAFPDLFQTGGDGSNEKSIGATRVLGKNIQAAALAASKSLDTISNGKFLGELDENLSSPLTSNSIWSLALQTLGLSICTLAANLAVTFIPLPEMDGPGTEKNWVLIFIYMPLMQILLSLTLGYFTPQKIIGTISLSAEGAIIVFWLIGELLGLSLYGMLGYVPLNGLIFIGTSLLLGFLVPLIFQISAIRTSKEFKFLYFEYWRNVVLVSVPPVALACILLILLEMRYDDVTQTLVLLAYHSLSLIMQIVSDRFIMAGEKSKTDPAAAVKDLYFVRSIVSGVLVEQASYYMVAASYLELQMMPFSIGLAIQFLSALSFPLRMQFSRSIKHAFTISMIRRQNEESSKGGAGGGSETKTSEPPNDIIKNSPEFLSQAVAYLLTQASKIFVNVAVVVLATCARSGPNAQFLPFSYVEDDQHHNFIAKCLTTAAILTTALVYGVWIIWRDRKINLMNIVPLIIKRHFLWLGLIFATTPLFVALLVLRHSNMLWYFVTVPRIGDD